MIRFEINLKNRYLVTSLRVVRVSTMACEMKSDLKQVAVRTVTRFIVLGRDESSWEPALVAASSFCVDLAATYATLGYETQSLRIVTNPFGEYVPRLRQAC